jgi:hypothetical protein
MSMAMIKIQITVACQGAEALRVRDIEVTDRSDPFFEALF